VRLALFALFATNELKNFELNWKDIEKSHPADASLYAECRKLLQICDEIQESIDDYSGAKAEITQAMKAQLNSDEQKEATRTAMQKVIPNAALAQSWMQFAQKLSRFLVKRLLPRLCLIDDESSAARASAYAQDDVENEDIDYDDGDEEKKQSQMAEEGTDAVSELTILTHQALVRELALMLDFLLSFDQKKMMEPQIQNDFSFYKRSMSKQSEAHLSDLEWSVSNEKAGFVSMFLAQAIPLQKEVATQLAMDPACLKILAIVCNACLDLLKENKFGKDGDSQRLALRAMTAAFVIYDHGNTECGAFSRRSMTKATKIVALITKDYEQLYGNKEHLAGLANMIKFATANFNDKDTPASIKNALED